MSALRQNYSTTLLIGFGLAAVLLAGCASTSRSSLKLSDLRTTEDEAFQAGADRPPTLRTRFLYARLLAAQGHHKEAEAALRTIVTEHSDFAPAYLELANIRMEQGQAKRALFYLRTALGASPDDPVIYNNLGVCYMTLKKHRKALESFTKAVEEAPENGRYRANMAMALGVVGRYDEALAVYRQVVDAGQAHYNTGLLAEANGSVERARVEYEEASLLDQSIPRAEALDK